MRTSLSATGTISPCMHAPHHHHHHIHTPLGTDKYAADKEKWRGESTMLLKRNESSTADIVRLEGSYSRLAHEKERLQAIASDATFQVTQHLDQVSLPLPLPSPSWCA